MLLQSVGATLNAVSRRCCAVAGGVGTQPTRANGSIRPLATNNFRRGVVAATRVWGLAHARPHPDGHAPYTSGAIVFCSHRARGPRTAVTPDVRYPECERLARDVTPAWRAQGVRVALRRWQQREPPTRARRACAAYMVSRRGRPRQLVSVLTAQAAWLALWARLSLRRLELGSSFWGPGVDVVEWRISRKLCVQDWGPRAPAACRAVSSEPPPR